VRCGIRTPRAERVGRAVPAGIDWHLPLAARESLRLVRLTFLHTAGEAGGV
jgi:hypothetical protein